MRNGKYNVIIVDDEPDFSHWLRLLLEGSEDFQVLGEASNGIRALSLAECTMPDLVIADIYMPYIDGFELTRYIRQHHPDTQVILISTYGEPIYERLAKQEGALAFISKENLSLKALHQTLQTG